MPQVCILSNVCHLFPPMLEALFSFLVHTFFGGFSRVASAMSTSPPDRSRSPMRNTGENPDGEAEVPKENPVAPTEVVPSGHYMPCCRQHLLREK